MSDDDDGAADGDARGAGSTDWARGLWALSLGVVAVRFIARSELPRVDEPRGGLLAPSGLPARDDWGAGGTARALEMRRGLGGRPAARWKLS